MQETNTEMYLKKKKEEKDRREYGRKRYTNMSEKKKQKIKEHQKKNYSLIKKVI